MQINILSFKDFILEDFKSSMTLTIQMDGKPFLISYDKMSLRKIDLKSYLTPFLRDKDILPKSSDNLRGILFFSKTNVENICFKNMLHKTILRTISKEGALPNAPNYLKCYEKMDMFVKGDTIPDMWCFTYTITKNGLDTTFSPTVLIELDKQKNAKDWLGLTDKEWKHLVAMNY